MLLEDAGKIGVFPRRGGDSVGGCPGDQRLDRIPKQGNQRAGNAQDAADEQGQRPMAICAADGAIVHEATNPNALPFAPSYTDSKASGAFHRERRNLSERTRRPAKACRPPRTDKHYWMPGEVMIWVKSCRSYRAYPYDLNQPLVPRTSASPTRRPRKHKARRIGRMPPQRYPKTGPLRLSAHLGDRTNTHGILSGAIRSPLVELNICGPKGVAQGFKPLVREAAFEVSELSIMTYLQAKAYGKPLVLVPAVVLGRFQHVFIACRTDFGDAGPRALEGRRVGIRSYTVTTVTWARAILTRQYGVDVDKITWVAYEDSHLAEFRDPANVERIDMAGRTLEQMLIDGDIDAAVLGREANDPRLCTLFPDAEQAARDWYRRFGTLQLNHLFVVNTELSQQRPDAVRAIYDMLHRAKQAAPKTELGLDVLPFGVANTRPHLQCAIDCAFEQKIIPRRFTADELFDDTTRALGG